MWYCTKMKTQMNAVEKDLQEGLKKNKKEKLFVEMKTMSVIRSVHIFTNGLELIK